MDAEGGNLNDDLLTLCLKRGTLIDRLVQTYAAIRLRS